MDKKAGNPVEPTELLHGSAGTIKAAAFSEVLKED